MKRRIIIFVLAIGVVAIVSLTSIISVINSRLMVTSTLKNNEGLAHVISITMDNYINEITKTANTLASSPIIKDAVDFKN